MSTVNLKPTFMNHLAAIKEDQVALYLSSGVDSISCLFGLLELGKQVSAYTFHVAGIESTDLKHARKVCETFSVPHTALELHMKDCDYLVETIYELKTKYQVYDKADIECCFPFYVTLPQVRESLVVSGLWADANFFLTKKEMIHRRNETDRWRIKHLELLETTDYHQAIALRSVFKDKGKTLVTPYHNADLARLFLGTTWDEINKPKQKQPILDMFPDQFSRIRVFPHTNLQLGDSGIAESFKILLKSKYNAGIYKSVVGVYNEI